MTNKKCIDIIHDIRNTLCVLSPDNNEIEIPEDAIKKLRKEVENLWVTCLDCSNDDCIKNNY